jgi:hypothetical protein
MFIAPTLPMNGDWTSIDTGMHAGVWPSEKSSLCVEIVLMIFGTWGF